jgi:hypothetical protein
MARPDIKQDSKTFLTTLRKIGAYAGNGALMATLGWSETRYWKVHAELVERAKIVKGRGRGGTVAIV